MLKAPQSKWQLPCIIHKYISLLQLHLLKVLKHFLYTVNTFAGECVRKIEHMSNPVSQKVWSNATRLQFILCKHNNGMVVL